jgi:hypothetical protein
MKVITDEKRIERNAKIGTWASLGGMAVLGIGLYLSLAQPRYLAVSMICLLAGIVLSNVGMYNANRWVKRPRPDEVLTKVLKGFDRRYYLYNYQLPVDHLLVGPPGLMVIVARNHEGSIRYADGRWRQKFNLLRAFGFLGEGVGNPVRDAERAASKMRQVLAEKLPELADTPVEPVIVFTNEKAELDVQNPPLPVLDPKGLQDFVRKASKDALSGGEIYQITEALEKE